MTARSTFREAAADVAWQKQLRDRFAAEGAPSVPLGLRSARVRRVSRRTAAQIILKYEWLGTMAQTGYHYGVFFGLHCAGVCCIAAGAATGGVNSHKPFGIQSSELGVLARGACTHWAPPGTNSKLVAWASRLFAEDIACKVLIAYSDTDAGEIGTIYQACGWIYIGKGSATRQWIAPSGRVFDQKYPWDQARKAGGTRAEWVTKLRAAGWTEQASNPKHRYVQVLDKTDLALIGRVGSMSQPYPKRATSIASDAPGVQSGEDGATPIVALHEAPP